MLTHSFLCDRTMFRYQVDALKSQYRVINIDLRGHGESGDSLSPYSLYDLVEDVIEVLDAESVQQAAWAGLSIGGFLSMRAALRHPERVGALVLMDTDAGPESTFKRLKYAALRTGVSLLGPKPIVPSLLPIFLGSTSLRERKSLCAEFRQKFLDMRVKSIIPGIGAIMSRDDVRSQLSQIQCPTLVIVGQEDNPLPPPKSQAIADRIRGSNLVVIPKSGHLSAVETPEEVGAALMAFLRKNYLQGNGLRVA